MTMRIVCLSLIATVLAVAPVRAQVRADPGGVIGNPIAVRVNVTLADRSRDRERRRSAGI